MRERSICLCGRMSAVSAKNAIQCKMSQPALDCAFSRREMRLRAKHGVHRFMCKFNAQAVKGQKSKWFPNCRSETNNGRGGETHKVAALAGTALAIAGPNPGKNAFNPPLAYTPLIVPPIVGRPSALCNLDLM